jgi:hypothetical protein
MNAKSIPLSHFRTTAGTFPEKSGMPIGMIAFGDLHLAVRIREPEKAGAGRHNHGSWMYSAQFHRKAH